MNKLHKLNQVTVDYTEDLLKRLKNKKYMAVYLEVSLDEYLQDGNLEAFLIALYYAAKAQGSIGLLAEKTKLNRESLYKTLSKKGNPKFETISRLLKALGLGLCIKTLKAA